MLQRWLAYPLTRGLDIDDPRTTHLRLQIIQEKSFLRHIYQEWYGAIVEALPLGQGAVLELGAGGGFMSDFVPDLITSEFFYCPNIRAVLDGLRLPFVAKSLRGIVMTNVLHHLPSTTTFFCRGNSLRAVWRRDGNDRAMGYPVVTVCLHPVTPRTVPTRNSVVGTSNQRSAFRRK